MSRKERRRPGMPITRRDHMHSTTSTSYYVTFQFESGDRSEFSLSGSQYGMLAENDTGMLTFQGTRYLGFERGND